MKNPKILFALGLILMSLYANADIINGEFLLDSSRLANAETYGPSCLVRYHGMVNYKKMYPNADVDPNLRVAVSYVEVGKPGEHGIAAKLPFKNMGDNFYRTSGFEFVEKDFNLKYTVTSENTAISPTGKNAFGELTLRIIDLETNEVVGQTEFPIETFFSGGYGPQLTISLPTKIIEKQKIGLTNDKNLLTQVRFQCN